MEKIKFEDFNVFIDPDSGFWAIADAELPDEVRKFWLKNRDSLAAEMKRYRFETDVKVVYVNPTDRCNASCPYCYIPGKIKSRGRDMSYEELSGVLNCLMDSGVEWVIFHGAEPLLVKDLIFKVIEEHDEFNYGIQTNGLLLNRDDMDFIMDSEINIGISFDSPRKDVNDFLRGKGHYDTAVRALDYMQGYKNLNVVTTITRYNYNQLADMVDFLAGKVEVVLMNPVRGTSEGGRKFRAPPVEAAGEFIKAVSRAIEHTKNGERIVIGDFANILLGIVAPTSRVLQCDISPCGGGRRFFAVASDGNVYPCGEFIGMEEFSVPFDEVVKNGCKNAFKSVNSRVVEKIEECRTCAYRHICGSPCPAEVYAEKGTFFEKSPYCEFYRAVIDYAFKIIAEGMEDFVIRKDAMKVKYSLGL